MELDENFILEQLKNKLDLNMDKIEKIYIYGSFVKEEKAITENSDIDVMVILKDYHNEEVISYDGRNPKKIEVKSKNKNFGMRTVDLAVGSPDYEQVNEDKRIY